MPSVTFCMTTPRRPRVTLPLSLSWATTFLAMLEGMANPMPMFPPVGVRMLLLMPMTSPFMLTSGPPLLPRLMAASVWMKSW